MVDRRCHFEKGNAAHENLQRQSGSSVRWIITDNMVKLNCCAILLEASKIIVWLDRNDGSMRPKVGSERDAYDDGCTAR